MESKTHMRGVDRGSVVPAGLASLLASAQAVRSELVPLAITLRALRDYRDITQDRLSRDAGLSIQLISSTERGDRDVSYLNLRRLFTELDFSWDVVGAVLHVLDPLPSRDLGGFRLGDVSPSSGSPNLNLVRLGILIRALRKHVGYSSQDTFSSATGLERALVGGVERGTRGLRYRKVRKCLVALTVSWSDFGSLLHVIDPLSKVDRRVAHPPAVQAVAGRASSIAIGCQSPGGR